jgi:outer membrane protein TolC
MRGQVLFVQACQLFCAGKGAWGRYVLVAFVCLLGGCTRSFYRRQADRETYRIIEQRNQDPRWAIPRISIDPPQQSRLFDPFDPDHPPMPPDDPAADQYMRRVFGMRGYRKWHRDGDAPWIEDPEWKNYLEFDKNGVLVLTPEKAVELGILNNFTYQSQLEGLYLSSLGVTLDRFQFEMQWFGTNDTFFTHFGSSADEQNTLSTSSALGFTRFLATGGQVTAEFLNSFLFQYAGPDTTLATSNLLFTFMQPLLQNAGRAVAMETLTEAERTLLYQIRSFAHFRKAYTFQVATSNYLSLLTQEQTVRNSRENIGTLEKNLHLYNALLEAGKVTAVNVEQVDIQLQTGQQQLIQVETSLEASEDSYKQLLGLPPNLPIHLDDSLLAQFQLNDPAIPELQKEVEDFQTAFRKFTEAPLGELRDGFRKLETFRARAIKLVDEVEGELDRWKKLPQVGEQPELARARVQANIAAVTRSLTAVRGELDDLKKKTSALGTALDEKTRKESTERLLRLTSNLTETVAELFVTQTRVRVYLIQLQPVKYDLESATTYALANRLDLMNQEAQVVDAWRQITVTAKALQAGLNLLASANIATVPGSDRALDFRASASTYSVGVHIDTPLNRLAQRNAYRASQIAYEQARRNYMALEDSIIEAIRDDMRQLRLNRISFDISRQSVVSAALTYESARENLLSPTADPTSTLNALLALSSLLSAQNSLIGTWAAYETTRYKLLLDMEALQLDDRGLYTNGHDNDAGQPATIGLDNPGQPILPPAP